MKTSRVVGLTEAKRALKQLPTNVQKRVLRNATAAGGREFRKEIKAAAPVHVDEQSPASKQYGTLKSNIRLLRLRRGFPDSIAAYRVDTGKAFWGLFSEFGTVVQAATPWFRPAVDSAFQRAVNAIKERLVVGIEREAEKLAKR